MSNSLNNPWDTSKLKHMKIEDDDETTAKYASIGTILQPYEAEMLIEKLKKFSIHEIGNSEWIEQHRVLERINMQAHASALSNSDEYVLETLLTFDKIEVIIHELLIIEIWKEYVYPHLLDRLAGKNSMRIYFILYHEATLVNLLEVVLYHKHIIEANGDKMFELVDYCARKLTRLNSGYDFRSQEPSTATAAKTAIEFAKDLESKSPIDELTKHFTEIEFQVCISAVGLARFLCEHAEVLPLNIISRINDTHDFLVLLLPLIENPPWTRRIQGKWQKLIDHKWKEVAPIDLLKVTKLEGQPWISVFHLLGKQVFRERYFLNSFRKGQLLRVRKYINEVMLDQLPFLADIQRFMDELAIADMNEAPSLTSGGFMFQQVAILRESLMKGKNWENIAEEQCREVFTMRDQDDQDLKKLAEIYSDDAIENIVYP
jgi:zinc finger MYND domain-containing protein 10